MTRRSLFALLSALPFLRAGPARAGVVPPVPPPPLPVYRPRALSPFGPARLAAIRAAVKREYEAKRQALFRATLDGLAQRGTLTPTAARMIAARASGHRSGAERLAP